MNKKAITYGVLGVIGLGALATCYFNRSPERIISIEGNLLSPADGVIKSIVNNHIEIFIRLTDIHIQRVPCNCVITNIKNIDNYNDFFTLETAFGSIIVERKGGILARSLRSFNKEGDKLIKGQPYGKILLGSHCWITVPEALTIKVKVNDILKAGQTVIA